MNARTIRLMLGMFLITLVSAGAHAEPVAAEETAAPPTPAQAALARLAALEGEWTGNMLHGDGQEDPATVTYAVTAGGSAVVETMNPGHEHEMVTVYHLDGDRLVLTHYCMLGNQPRMAAEPDGSDTLTFRYDGGTNIDADTDMHMHDAAITFLGADRITAVWTMYHGGEPQFDATMQLERVAE